MSLKTWIRAGLAAAAIGGSAGSAWAQVRVSGIEHTKLGGAVLGTPTERRLPVGNIGSSGQDGVEVRLNSRWGGSVSLDLDGLLAPSPEAREFRIKQKAWDGTFKGRLRLASRPPDGTPGSSLDLECDFAAVSATTVRVTVRDQAGNVVLDGVRAGSSLACVVSMSPPAGIVPTCGVAIKEKATGAENNRAMSVDFGDVPCDVSGLSSVTLHEVRSIEFEPETCGACDTWLGTESMLVTSVGLSSMVVSDASLGTFGASSHAPSAATIDEECDDATDCDDDRRLHMSNIGSSGQDGVSIDLRKGSIGASVTFDCFAGGLPGRPVAMEQWFDTFDGTGPVRMRVSREVDALSGLETISCDSSELGDSEVDVYCFDSSGALLHSYREPTAVFAFACTAGTETRTQETWSCLHQRWSIDMTTPDSLVLIGGVPVPGVSAVQWTRVRNQGTLQVRRMYIFGGIGTESIDIKHVNDPPTVVHVGGIQGIAMDKGLLTQEPDGTLLVTTPCCDNDSDNDGLDDGVEMRTYSATGGTVTLDAGPLLVPGATGELRTKFRGWDGTIKGVVRMGGGGSGGGAGGSFALECDFAAMGAVEVQWEALDENGVVLGTGTVAGSSLGGITVTPEPVGSLLMPALMKAKEKANRTKCSIVITDRDCGVVGLTPDTLHNVRSIGFTPIEPAGSPPWADLDAMLVTFSGIPSLHVLDASLLTFGVEWNGIKNGNVGEVCDDGNSCDESRKIRITAIGSSGEDGVGLRRDGNVGINEPLPETTFHIARGTCCRGHVTVLKCHDEGGVETMRLTSSSDADQLNHTMSFDATGSGATGVTLTLYDQFGSVVHTHQYGNGSGGDITYIGPCDAPEPRQVKVHSGGMCMELCEQPVTVSFEGLVLPGVQDVCYEITVMPGTGSELRSISVTGNPTDYMEISNLQVIEGEPPCAADFNGDGLRDVPDIFAFLSAWFAQSPSADMNGDGTISVPDIFAFLSLWFAGCP